MFEQHVGFKAGVLEIFFSSRKLLNKLLNGFFLEKSVCLKHREHLLWLWVAEGNVLLWLRANCLVVLAHCRNLDLIWAIANLSSTFFFCSVFVEHQRLRVQEPEGAYHRRGWSLPWDWFRRRNETDRSTLAEWVLCPDEGPLVFSFFFPFLL